MQTYNMSIATISSLAIATTVTTTSLVLILGGAILGIGIALIITLIITYMEPISTVPTEGVDTIPTTQPMPGVKCPACLKKGEEQWVIPGKCCPQCGHQC